jgi:hypothetical protein
MTPNLQPDVVAAAGCDDGVFLARRGGRRGQLLLNGSQLLEHLPSLGGQQLLEQLPDRLERHGLA